MKKDWIFAVPLEQVEEFAFTPEVAEIFDDMVSRSVPFYHETQRMTGELANEFAQPQSRIYDLGCSTGTTLSLLRKVINVPGIQLVGIDNSKAMLRKAKDRLSDAGPRRRLVLRSTDLNGDVEISRASVVILNWTLQFVRPLNRKRLIRQIFTGLLRGGCLIINEKILPNDLCLGRPYVEFHQAFKRRHGYTELEIAKKREALENVLIPYRIEENIALLMEGGFSPIDLFFRWYNFAGLLAIKR